MCRVHLPLHFLSAFLSNDLLIVYLGLLCVIYIVVHSITHSLCMISSCSFIGMCYNQRQCIPRKNGFHTFLASKLCPLDFFFKNSCTPHKSVTFLDIFMQFNRNKY